MWEAMPLGKLRRGVEQIDPRRIDDGTYDYIEITSIDRTRKEVTNPTQVAREHLPSRARQLVEAEDLLVSLVRPGLGGIALVPENLGGALASSGFGVIRVDRSKVLPRLLFHFFRQAGVSGRLASIAEGAAYPAIKEGDLNALVIPLPALKEQQRIVELLDEADALRRLRAEADARAARVVPALFGEMFGDPSSNPRAWPTAPLGELGELDRGRSRHRPRTDPSLLGGVHPLIQTGDVARAHWRLRTWEQTYSDLGLAQSRKWPRGTLCISIAANIANAALLDFDACFPDSVVGFVPGPRISSMYLLVLLSFLREQIDAEAPQAAQKNINLQVLRRLQIMLPPYELQQKFATAMEEHLALDDLRATSRARLDAIFDEFLRRAFTGELTARWREAHAAELTDASPPTTEKRPPDAA